MAEENLKDFTVNWIIAGLLMFCLLAFSISFIYNNNNDYGLDDETKNVFNSDKATFQDKLLTESKQDSNQLLNITANTNPEVSELGSRDSVAAGFGAKDSGLSFWTNSKKLISLVFSGDSGKIILGSIGSIIAFLGGFYIWRFIRIGS